jgi:two-component system chemotaxis response regulator CheB
MEKPYTLSGMSDSDELNPTMIGCPACKGVLALAEDTSSKPHLVCSVGHRFSLESLLEAKEEDLEKSLWSAIALLAHLDMVIRMLLEQPEAQQRNALTEALHKRLAQARLHAEELRTIIEDSERPNLSIPVR